MSRKHPDHRMDIPVSLEVYHQLLRASAGTGYAKEDWEIAAEAIDEWMRRHSQDTIPMPVTKGVQWKRLFLPDGTLLRTVFEGKNHHCLVEGDRILYDGKEVSPSGFVNAVGGIRRNAWRCTWILLPGEKEWKLADTLRTRERPRRDRKTANRNQQILAGQPEVVRTPVNIPPVADPNPARTDAIAASEPDEPSMRRASLDTVQRSSLSGDGLCRQGRAATTLALPRCRRGTDRPAGGADWMSALLRDELLPLLHRLGAIDALRRETNGWQHMSPGSH